MVNGASWSNIFLRSWGLWLLQLVPSWRHSLERGPRADGPTQYMHTPEMPFLPESGGGISFPQTYCISLRQDTGVQFTDDVIFSGKKAIFQIVVLLNAPNEMESAIQDMEGITTDGHLLSPDEATFFVPRDSCESAPAGRRDAVNQSLFRTATSHEFARSPLCKSRPEPRGYRETLMWDGVGRKRYVVVRFDRFVFATCDSKTELERVSVQLSNLF